MNLLHLLFMGNGPFASSHASAVGNCERPMVEFVYLCNLSFFVVSQDQSVVKYRSSKETVAFNFKQLVIVNY